MADTARRIQCFSFMNEVGFDDIPPLSLENSSDKTGKHTVCHILIHKLETIKLGLSNGKVLCVYLCVCGCGYSYVHTCTWRPEDSIGCYSSRTIDVSFDRVSHRLQLGWLAGESLRIHFHMHFILWALGFQLWDSTCPAKYFFCRFWVSNSEFDFFFFAWLFGLVFCL